MNKIEIGSVVKLTCGGPRMTITTITDDNGRGVSIAKCEWFCQYGHEGNWQGPYSGEWPLKSLEIHKQPPARSK